MSGVARVASIRKYNGTLRFLPWQRPSPGSEPVPMALNAQGTGPASMFDAEGDHSQWKEVTGTFVSCVTLCCVLMC